MASAQEDYEDTGGAAASPECTKESRAKKSPQQLRFDPANDTLACFLDAVRRKAEAEGGTTMKLIATGKLGCLDTKHLDAQEAETYMNHLVLWQKEKAPLGSHAETDNGQVITDKGRAYIASQLERFNYIWYGRLVYATQGYESQQTVSLHESAPISQRLALVWSALTSQYDQCPPAKLRKAKRDVTEVLIYPTKDTDGNGSIDASETGGGGDTSTSPASRIRNDELPRMAAAALSISHPPVLRARGTSEPGRLLPAAWLIPRKHLLWLGGGGTVGSTHFDPYENLMAVIGGQKTFHLARPEDGSKLGAHQMMAEGGLKLERRVADDTGAANAGADFLSRHRLVRSPSAVDDALDLHHYATASLSAPDGEPQLGLPHLSEVTRVRCSAKAGEVIYTPSYWWHEVTSHASDDGRPDGDAKSRRAVIALNWFFEPYYTRVFPNRSFERSPHYVLLDQQRPLDDPFPARIPSAAATARTPMDDALSASAGTAERSAGRGGTSRFNVRLRESKRERATGRQPTRPSHDSNTSSGGAKTEL